MAFRLTMTLAFLATASISAAQSCNQTALNTTEFKYPVTVDGMTVAQVANATGRGICDIGRYNCMADVDMPMSVGQELLIPGEVCEPDSTTCRLSNATGSAINTCVMGGPRLYYTQKGDTYERVALRLNVTVDTVANGANATAPLTAGQFVKIPLCYPSQCTIQPYRLEYGTYKDLADEYGTTLGQIMSLSPTYNFSEWRITGYTPPTVDIPMNCTLLSDNTTVYS